MKRKSSIFLIVLLFFALIVTIIIGSIYDKYRETKIDAKIEERNDEFVNVGVGKQLKYIPLGDSLTAGYFATEESNAYVNVFCNMLKENMGFEVIKADNKIIRNNRYGAVLQGTLTQENLSYVNSQKPDLVTIEYGTNDSNKENNVSPEVFKKQLNTLIDSISGDNKPIIALLTTWNKYNEGNGIDKVIKEVGQERHLPVVDLSDIWKNDNNKGPAGVNTWVGISDKFHPNDQGMKEIADKLYESTDKLIYNRFKN